MWIRKVWVVRMEIYDRDATFYGARREVSGTTTLMSGQAPPPYEQNGADAGGYEKRG